MTKNKKPKPKETLAERIKRLRITQGHSLKEMAERLKISPAMLAQVEGGVKRMPEKRLRSFAKVIGCDIEDLLDIDTHVPVAALQAKANTDPNFMKLLHLLCRTKRPTLKIIDCVTKEDRSRLES